MLSEGHRAGEDQDQDHAREPEEATDGSDRHGEQEEGELDWHIRTSKHMVVGPDNAGSEDGTNPGLVGREANGSEFSHMEIDCTCWKDFQYGLLGAE